MSNTNTGQDAGVHDGQLNHEVLSLIRDRRSTRSGFCNEPIPDGIISKVVSSGLAAPSSKNAQPWKLHVLGNRELLKEMSREVIASKSSRKFVPQDPTTGEPRIDLLDTVDESAHVLGNVPVGIFIENSGIFCVDRATVANARPESREGAIFGFGLEYIGLGACIQNMWLTATACGLSGVFMGDVAIAEQYIKERLGMIGDLVGVLALGYSDLKIDPTPAKQGRVIWH